MSSWSTSSETLRVLRELVRLNATTASLCQFAAARQRDTRLWRALSDLGDESFHFKNSLCDRIAYLGPAAHGRPESGRIEPRPIPAVSDATAADSLASVSRQLARRVAAYDQALAEPVDCPTRDLLRRQRQAATFAQNRLASLGDSVRAAEAA